MLKAIECWLPVAGEKEAEAFRLFSDLLKGPQAVCDEDSIALREPNLFPQIVFRAKKDEAEASLHFMTSEGAHRLPETYIYRGGREGSALSFEDFAARMKGKIKRMDHLGLAVPAAVTPEDWHRYTSMLVTEGALYQIPPVPGFNTEGSRLLFLVPATEEEVAKNKIETRRRRQPKMEYIYDPKIPTPGFHFDLETPLSREEVIALFPGNDSYDIPGRGNVFRTISVNAPWNGAKFLRFDLRFGAVDELTPVTSAECFTKDAIKVNANDPQTKIG